MFASDTLYELRVALQLAETEREGVSQTDYTRIGALIRCLTGLFTTYLPIRGTARRGQPSATNWL